MSNTSMVLVLDNGTIQQRIGESRWQNISGQTDALKLLGLTGIRQEVNAIGWRFDAIFSHEMYAHTAQADTGWHVSKLDSKILFATASVDYETGKPELLLTTASNKSFRILWRSWSIELLDREPKRMHMSPEDRHEDIAASEGMRTIKNQFGPFGGDIKIGD
jgi:hypothetical protein